MPKQRFSRRNPCPICGGSDDAERGAGVRCHGFAEGDWAHCSREERAGGLPMNSESSTYAHRLVGSCKCGVRHDPRPDTGGNSANRARSRIVKTYDYRDEQGSLLYQAVRWEPKAFNQRRPTDNSHWVWGLSAGEYEQDTRSRDWYRYKPEKPRGGERRQFPDTRLVLYHLPALLAADKDRPWFVVEGEKDAENLESVGLIAVTCAQGAKKWRSEYSETLRGCHVVILPDNDDTGRQHANQVARALVGIAASIKVVALPGLAPKGDVSDWLGQGYGPDDLTELVEKAPEWVPPTDWFGDAEPTEPELAPEPDSTLDPLSDARLTLQQIATADQLARALADPVTVGNLARLAADEPGTFSARLIEMRGHGVKSRDIDTFSRAIAAAKRPALRIIRNGHEQDMPRIKAVLPDAPVPDSAIVPTGWRIGTNGVARERTTTADSGDQQHTVNLVASSPIVLAGRLTYVGTGTEAIRVAWLRDHVWRHYTVDRAAIANARKIVDVAAFGFPVTSGTAGDLVDYLAAFESVNLQGLPRAKVSNQLGWQGQDGEFGFLWGRQLIRPDGDTTQEIKIEEMAPQDWREDWIAFRGEDAGDDQHVAGFNRAGTWEGWMEAVEQSRSHPRVMLGFYAALSTPLLLLTGTPNFAIDWAGQTTTGKTTSLRLGASVWGNPDERAPAAVISTWDNTAVWMERAAALRNYLPLILDDTKQAKNQKQIPTIVYNLTQGRGRGRGSPLGTRQVVTWHNVILSSGEGKITDFSEDGGTRVRVLSVWGSPFRGGTVDLVNKINFALLQHYGHAGPRFVQWLLQNRGRWPEWREEYFRQTVHYQTLAGINPFKGRLAQPFALLDLTVSLAHLAFGWAWEGRKGQDGHDRSDVVGHLWKEISDEADEADRAKVALEYCCRWAVEHQNQFYGRHENDHEGNTRTPSVGWAGVWQQDTMAGGHWGQIAFSRGRLDQVLKEAGYEPKAITRQWKDRGYTLSDREGNPTVVVNLAGVSTRMVAIPRATVESIGLELVDHEKM